MNSRYNERLMTSSASMASALAASAGSNPHINNNSTDMGHYLNHLKNLVPGCPKSNNMSSLEVLQHVIDYIGDLQDTLTSSDSESESPPESPIGHVSFSDGFAQQVQQFHGYGSLHSDNFTQEIPFGGQPTTSRGFPSVDYSYRTTAYEGIDNIREPSCYSRSSIDNRYDQPMEDDYGKPLAGNFDTGFQSFDARYPGSGFGSCFNTSR